MSVPLPHNVDDLKTMIGREVTSLRAVVRRTAERSVPAPPGTDVTAPVHALAEVPVAESTAPCLCGTHDRDATGLCSALTAIPASAALLEPLLDDSGVVRDFRIVAGNRMRSAEWLEAPDHQVGQRFLEARPGAAQSGLLSALADLVENGGTLESRVVDYTEQRLGRLHRTPCSTRPRSAGSSCSRRGGPYGARPSC
ncbi:hypothetical protein ACQ86F_00095 [Streptomyces venezuelae ATCC 10712]